jgi:uncharacterized protein (TIGR02145 family)
MATRFKNHASNKITALIAFNIRNYAVGVFLLWIGFYNWMPVYPQTAVGGSSPHTSAMLDIQSDSKGVLFPRMTSIQRNQIHRPASGLMIFNTETICLEINLGTADTPYWQPIKCVGTISSLNCAGAIRKGEMQPNFQADGVSVIVPYSGGNGDGHSGQIVHSTGVTDYTATLAAGNFAAGIGTLVYQITGGLNSTSGTASFALNIGGQSCTLDLEVRSCSAKVSPTETKIFSCYNLGAYNTRADPFMPSYEINGGYWQWGRKAEAAAGPSGNSLDSANAGAIAGWNTTIALSNAWEDNTKTDNDPCPAGFRIPTITQWTGVRTNNTLTNVGTTPWTSAATSYSSGIMFGNDLFLPAAGYRAFNSGELFERGFYGGYRSSTWSATDRAWFMFFYSNFQTNFDNNPTHGASLRCIAEGLADN